MDIAISDPKIRVFLYALVRSRNKPITLAVAAPLRTEDPPIIEICWMEIPKDISVKEVIFVNARMGLVVRQKQVTMSQKFELRRNSAKDSDRF